MSEFNRRDLLASSAALSILSVIPNIAFAAGHGGTLRVAIAGETGDLDLLQNVSTLSSYTVVFDALVHYGTGGKLEPGLATSWNIAADGKSIRFELRQGVKFSDGTPFDADAAEWNLKRWMGVSDFSWIGIADAFERISKNGKYQLTVHLKRPVPAGLLELAVVRPVRFLSPKAVSADGKQKAPIGTGPWIVQKHSTSETVLVRNDKYWGEKPAFERMELKVIPDELARANALRAGEVDVIGGDWVAQLSPRRAKALAGEGMKIVAEPGTATTILGYSPKSPMMQDKGVRQAVSLGIDRASLASVLFEGFAEPTMDIFPTTVPMSGKRHKVPARDVAAAQAALKASGWKQSGSAWTKNGKPLEVDFLVSEETFPGSRRMSEMIQAMLTQVGFKVRISSVDNATMHDRRPKFEYDLTFFGTYGAPYDPHGSLGASFVSTVDTGPDGKIYISDELDKVAVKALETSGNAREAAMQSAYDWLYDNVAACPILVTKRIWAVHSRVKGFSLPATDYDLPFKGIKLG